MAEQVIQTSNDVPANPTSDPLMGAFETETEKSNGKQSSPQAQPKTVQQLQSERDKFAADLTNLTQTVDEYRNVVNAFDLLQKDPEYRRAWLAEVEPDLFKNDIDIDGEVEKVLSKEFPDFRPNLEERSTPGTKSYRYYRRADKLYEQFENKKPVEVKSLKEVLENRKNESKKKAEKFQADIERLKRERNWNDATIDRMKTWIQNLNVFDYAKMFNFAMTRIDPTLVKGPTNLAGNKVPGDLQSKVSELLGPRRSGPKQ